MARSQGFACYDSTGRGLFGPIGVAREARGRGIGRGLLLSCLHAMSAAGYAYAVVAGVEAAEFYQRTVGATEIPGFNFRHLSRPPRNLARTLFGVPTPMHASAQDRIQPELQPPAELSLGEALSLAVHAHREGYLDNAELLYRRILEVAPEQSDAMHFFGVLLHHRGRSGEAVELIRRSIALDPGTADRYNNLGNVLVECGRAGRGRRSLPQRARRCSPDMPMPGNNLGAALRGAWASSARRRPPTRKPSTLDPEHVDAYNNMGNLLSARGRIKEAVAYYCKAITLMPNHPEARKLLGIAYYTLGPDRRRRRGVPRAGSSDEPDNPIALHMRAACSGRGRAGARVRRLRRATLRRIRGELRVQARAARLPRPATGRGDAGRRLRRRPAPSTCSMPAAAPGCAVR